MQRSVAQQLAEARAQIENLSPDEVDQESASGRHPD